MLAYFPLRPRPHSTLRFHYEETKCRKYFRPHWQSRFVFTYPHWFVSIRKRIPFDTFSPGVHSKDAQNVDDQKSQQMAVFSSPFSKPPFSPAYSRNGAFFKRLHFQNHYPKVCVFISVIGHFSVNDRLKHIKMYTLLYENALVWQAKTIAVCGVCYAIVLHEPNNMKQSLK